MKFDIRTEAAKFYDSNPTTPDDIPFYQRLIPFPDATILELGCGTGRVTLPLIRFCQYIHGIDLSPAMLAISHEKLRDAGIPDSKARVEVGDISDFHLGRTFDFIIAPFRVIQNLETEQEIDGLFHCIHDHLASGGSVILNAFRPNRDPEDLRKQWIRDEEIIDWEVPVEGGKLVCLDRRPRMDKEKLILYPELIYRRYEGEKLTEEARLRLIMKCYYPQAFEQLIIDHSFTIINRWGGYAGEMYGGGPELVIQFTENASVERPQIC